MDKKYQWEMFSLNKDSDEIVNLYSNPQYMDVKVKLKKELSKLIKTYGETIVLPTLDKYNYSLKLKISSKFINIVLLIFDQN